MTTTRAKFRVLHITEKFDGMFTVHLGAVNRSGKDPENAAFWKYTPNGTMDLTFYKTPHDSDGKPFVVGAYYYLDMTKVALEGNPTPGQWSLSERKEIHQDNLGVVLYATTERFDWQKREPAGMVSGQFQMNLSKEAEGARLGFNRTGALWTIGIIFAEPSDGER